MNLSMTAAVWPANRGWKTCLVTNGYVNPEPLEQLLAVSRRDEH